MQLSKLWSLNLQDLLKGAITSALTTAISSISVIIYTQRMPTANEWQLIGLAAASTFVGYVLKNFGTPTPKTIQIDPAVTAVVDLKSKEVISDETERGK